MIPRGAIPEFRAFENDEDEVTNVTRAITVRRSMAEGAAYVERRLAMLAMLERNPGALEGARAKLRTVSGVRPNVALGAALHDMRGALQVLKLNLAHLIRNTPPPAERLECYSEMTKAIGELEEQVAALTRASA